MYISISTLLYALHCVLNTVFYITSFSICAVHTLHLSVHCAVHNLFHTTSFCTGCHTFPILPCFTLYSMLYIPNLAQLYPVVCAIHFIFLHHLIQPVTAGAGGFWGGCRSLQVYIHPTVPSSCHGSTGAQLLSLPGLLSGFWVLS